eukprot:29214_2
MLFCNLAQGLVGCFLLLVQFFLLFGRFFLEFVDNRCCIFQLLETVLKEGVLFFVFPLRASYIFVYVFRNAISLGVAPRSTHLLISTNRLTCSFLSPLISFRLLNSMRGTCFIPSSVQASNHCSEQIVYSAGFASVLCNSMFVGSIPKTTRYFLIRPTKNAKVVPRKPWSFRRSLNGSRRLSNSSVEYSPGTSPALSMLFMISRKVPLMIWWSSKKTVCSPSTPAFAKTAFRSANDFILSRVMFGEKTIRDMKHVS